MNVNKIKKNAPSGATHYDRTGYYLKKTERGYFVYSKLGWGWSQNPLQITNNQVVAYGIKPL